jgi:hypothetical protein
MEGMTRVKESAVCVERCFAASRLEKQVLAAAYELVIPLLRQPLTGTPPERWRRMTQLRACSETTARPIGLAAPMARGA